MVLQCWAVSVLTVVPTVCITHISTCHVPPQRHACLVSHGCLRSASVHGSTSRQLHQRVPLAQRVPPEIAAVLRDGAAHCLWGTPAQPETAGPNAGTGRRQTAGEKAKYCQPAGSHLPPSIHSPACRNPEDTKAVASPTGHETERGGAGGGIPMQRSACCSI